MIRMSKAWAMAATFLLIAATTAVAAPLPQEVPTFANPPAQLGHCDVVTFPATLPGGASARLVGHLCTPRISRHAATVQVLLHGATYNASYWSWPLDSARQSYVWQALEAGYSVLALDRLGYGESTHPASSADTFTAQALTIHQVVIGLRQRGYRTLVGVGHSFGSAELDNEAATYPRDFDALILTGSGSTTSAQTSAQSRQLAAVPGAPDPGYLTSVSVQARAALLYDPQDVRPGTVAFDYATEDTLPIGEITSRPASLDALTATLRVPVLLLDGMHDSHYCDGAQVVPESGLDDCSSSVGLFTSERAHYASACFAAAVVPRSGHDLTTEDGARSAARTMMSWLSVTLASGRSRCAVRGAISPQR